MDNSLSLLHDNDLKILIPIAIILIPAFLSLFYSFAFLTFKLLLNSKSTFINILSFSLVLSLFEFIRGTVLSGFPWNLFAYSLSENIEFYPSEERRRFVGVHTTPLNLQNGSKVYVSGMSTTSSQLGQRSYTIGISSSKLTKLSRDILDELKIILPDS